jgi:hypothetical protein
VVVAAPVCEAAEAKPTKVVAAIATMVLYMTVFVELRKAIVTASHRFVLPVKATLVTLGPLSSTALMVVGMARDSEEPR